MNQLETGLVVLGTGTWDMNIYIRNRCYHLYYAFKNFSEELESVFNIEQSTHEYGRWITLDQLKDVITRSSNKINNCNFDNSIKIPLQELISYIKQVLPNYNLES